VSTSSRRLVSRVRAKTGCQQSQHGIQLFDDFVSADQERFRNRQPETFRGLGIDHEFERAPADSSTLHSKSAGIVTPHRALMEHRAATIR